MKLRLPLAVLTLIGASTVALSGVQPVSASDPTLITIDSLGAHFNLAQVATCGIDDSGTGGTQGTVWCWGNNTFGQLGDGTTTTSTQPVRVSPNAAAGFNNTQVTDISVGNTSACAIEGGTVFCWGSNSLGQLGDGTNTNSPTPVKVANNASFTNANIASVSVGSGTACAINQTGVAFCWGTNSNGRLGINVAPATTASSSLPMMVADSAPFVNGQIAKIEVGYLHACLLKDAGANDKKVYCWGATVDGQVGGAPTYSSTTNLLVPTLVPSAGGFSNTNVTDFSAGEAFSCAVEGGVTRCWGGNRGGTSSGAPSWPPVTVAAADGFANTAVTSVRAGAFLTCATEGGAAYCWGSDLTRGAGATPPSGDGAAKVAATATFPNSNVAEITMSPFGACGLEAGKVSCWGYLPGASGSDGPAASPTPLTWLSAPTAGTIDTSAIDTSGGTLVVTGTGFTGATSVTFGSTTATFTVDSDTQITITVPALSAGTVTLSIVTPGGTLTQSVTISEPTTTTAAPTTTVAASTAAPTTTVASPNTPTLVTESNQAAVTAPAGSGVLIVEGRPVEVQIIQASEELRRTIAGARTAEQVTAIREVATAMLTELRSLLGESSVLPIAVRNVATGAVISGLVTDPVTGADIEVPVEDIAFITGGGIALMVGGADGSGDPANIAFDGVLEFGEGGFVSVLAYGLTPGAEGEVIVMSSPLLLDTFEVGDDGGVAAQAQIPGTLAAGDHTVVVSIGDQSASLGFRVLAPGVLPSTGQDSPVPWAVLVLAAGAFAALLVTRRRSLV